MKTNSMNIEVPHYYWPYENIEQPMYFSPDDDDDDDSGDWGTVDPLEHDGPPSEMDPSAPGSAV